MRHIYFAPKKKLSGTCDLLKRGTIESRGHFEINRQKKLDTKPDICGN